MRSTLHILIVIFFCIGCSTSKQSYNPGETTLLRTAGDEPQVVFIVYSIKKGENSTIPTASISTSLITPGKLKIPYRGNLTKAEVKSYTIAITDKDGKVISQHHNADVLTENVEYIEDDGSFARKDITHLEKEIVYRAALQDDAKKIKLLYNTSPSSNPINLSTITLKQ